MVPYRLLFQKKDKKTLSKNMNILQVTLGFYPATAWGGPVKIVYLNSREMVRRGHQVTVYCTNLLNKKEKIKPITFEQNIEGIRIVYFNTWRLPWWPGTLGPFWLPQLSHFLKCEINTFDVIHLNGYRSPMLLSVVRSAQSSGIPVVTQPHGILPVIVNSLIIKRLYDHIFGRNELKGISALLALQESERQQALAYNVPPARIEIIPNGIDPAERENLPRPGYFRSRYGLDKNKPIILFLGRINRKKGTDLLIHAFARLEDLDIQLVIAGPDDGQLAEVKSLVQQYGLNNRVILPGLLTGSDVLSAFQDSNLFVLPCRTDTFPTTMMESCLMDIPMVITDRCEIAYMVKDRVAEVVPFDAQAFADGMRLLLTDRNRYDRYKTNCKAMVADHFSIQAVADRLEVVYQRVVAEKARS